jgi:cytochrome P450
MNNAVAEASTSAVCQVPGSFTAYRPAAKVTVAVPPSARSWCTVILTTDPPLHDTRRRVLNAQLVSRQVAGHHDYLVAQAERLAASIVASNSATLSGWRPAGGGLPRYLVAGLTCDG